MNETKRVPVPAPANLAAGPPEPPNTEQCPGDHERKTERKRKWGKREDIPLTAAAGVSRGTVVTGRLAVRIQITGLGEPVGIDGHTP